MRALNTNYDIGIEVLSPLHIGANQEKNWLRGIDFIQYKGEIFILDKEKVFSDLDDQSQDKYLSLISAAKLMELEQFISKQIDPERYHKTVYGYNGKLPSNEIKTLIRGGNGKPYIPGSSIKGAIASTVFNFLFDKYHQRLKRGDDLNDSLLGSFSHSLFRYIRPYDATCDQTELCNVELFNLSDNAGRWESRYKKGFNILTIENFSPKAKGNFRLSLADGLGRFLMMKRGPRALPRYYDDIFLQGNTIEFLFELINAYTREHIRREIEFFEEFPQEEDTDLIIENLEKWQEMTRQDKQTCILRMAGGIGFHAITGDWRYQDHIEPVYHPDRRNLIRNEETGRKEPARYKSRKVIRANAEVMGFVKLSLK